LQHRLLLGQRRGRDNRRCHGAGCLRHHLVRHHHLHRLAVGQLSWHHSGGRHRRRGSRQRLLQLLLLCHSRRGGSGVSGRAGEQPRQVWHAICPAGSSSAGGWLLWRHAGLGHQHGLDGRQGGACLNGDRRRHELLLLLLLLLLCSRRRRRLLSRHRWAALLRLNLLH
jgi:hypothetical protein